MSWGVIHNNEPDIDAACCVFGNSDFVAKTDDVVNLKSIEATNTAIRGGRNRRKIVLVTNFVRLG